MRRKIRVLQLIDGFNLGGAETVVAILSKNLDRTRFEVIPCALYRSGPLEEDLRAADVNYHIFGMKRRSVLSGPLFVMDFVRLLKAVTSIVRKLSIDIVHAHLIESSLIGILAARLAGVPSVCVTVHSIVNYVQRGRCSPRQWLMESAIQHMFSRADRLIAVSKEVACGIDGQESGRVITIANGIDPNRFCFQENRLTIRQKLGLPSCQPLLSVVGRLAPEKGHSYLLRAMALIPSNRRPVILIVGDGVLRAELEHEATALQLDDHVRFLGIRRDVPELLAASDIFVLPSHWEGLSLSLLEAMACGLPVIVTRVGGNTEVVEENQSGVLVPARDHVALAQAILRLLDDPVLRQRLGQGAYDRFKSKYSLEHFVKAHEALYMALHNAEPLQKPLT
jgi:glycosyltransferase involved in cell wall biosynthesis